MEMYSLAGLESGSPKSSSQPGHTRSAGSRGESSLPPLVSGVPCMPLPFDKGVLLPTPSFMAGGSGNTQFMMGSS